MLGIVALAAIAAVQILHRAMRAAAGNAVKSTFGFGDAKTRTRRHMNPLAAAGAGGVLGYLLGRRKRPRVHTAFRVATATGDVECRYPRAPEAVPIAAGDCVSVWGRRDGARVLRAARLRNETTGVTDRAYALSGRQAAAVVISAVLIVLAITSFHG